MRMRTTYMLTCGTASCVLLILVLEAMVAQEYPQKVSCFTPTNSWFCTCEARQFLVSYLRRKTAWLPPMKVVTISPSNFRTHETFALMKLSHPWVWKFHAPPPWVWKFHWCESFFRLLKFRGCESFMGANVSWVRKCDGCETKNLSWVLPGFHSTILLPWFVVEVVPSKQCAWKFLQNDHIHVVGDTTIR